MYMHLWASSRAFRSGVNRCLCTILDLVLLLYQISRPEGFHGPFHTIRVKARPVKSIKEIVLKEPYTIKDGD